MAVIESDVAGLAPSWEPKSRKATLALMGTAAALAVAIVSFLIRGGDQNAARFAALMVFRASSVAFLLYYLAAPVARIFRSRATLALARKRTGFALAFVCMFAVFLGCVLIPGYMSGAHIPLPTWAFSGLSALILGVVLAGEYAHRADAEWRSALRTMESIGVAYFWIAYAADGLDHISGPHRPDAYYGIALTVLVLALLVRFAGGFAERYRLARG
jgi:hypothetical protein